VLKYALTLLSPAGERGRLSILIFHRVLRQPDPLAQSEPDAGGFEARMRWIRNWFTVLPLASAAERLRQGDLPARALSITFDDGYADNAEVAAPILERLGLPATFFVTTGFLQGGCMWNDRIIEALRNCTADELDLTELGLGRVSLQPLIERRGAIARILDGIKHRLPEQRAEAVETVVRTAGGGAAPTLMMNAEQVRGLVRRGMDVGAHTVSHPILTRLATPLARAEILDSKARLEDLIERPVTLFAYPNGVPGDDYSAEHIQTVREAGFVAAVSTAWGAASTNSDLYQLPRFTPWDRTRLRYGARLAWNLSRRDYAVV
jgi:peptidoglycan/xylan/chitin deacetylase (PgdA/CDA1 family)